MNVEQIIKKYKIEQIHFCPTANKKKKEKIMKIKNIKKYENIKKPAIFYGCKNLETRTLIKNHKGERVIFWREKDVLNNTKDSAINKMFLQNNINNDKIKNFIFDKNNFLKKLEINIPKIPQVRVFIPKKIGVERIQLLFYGTLLENQGILDIINDFKILNGKRSEIYLKIIYNSITGQNNFVNTIKNIIKSRPKGIIFKNIDSISDVLKEALNCDIGISRDNNLERLKIYKTANLLVVSNILNNPVLCMLDEFTYQTYKNDLNLYYLHYTPDVKKYKKIIQFYKPKVLFAESFWKGVDWSWNKKAGKYKYVRYITKVAKLCGVKTIFWNKEDPVHFEKWSKYAEQFEYVFTTDYNLIEEYKKLGCNNVDVLPFAANTNIFNIIKKDSNQENKIIFAGAWYSRFKHRSILLKNILRKIGQNLIIYDRNYYRNDPDYYYPSQFNPCIKPSVSLAELCDIYKSNKFILNLNSVTESPTMFARRIFEIICSGAFPISNFNLGLDLIFAGYLNFIDTNNNDFSIGNLNFKKYLCCLKHSFKNFTTKSTIKYILGDKLSTQTISENVAIIYYVQTEQINNFNISLLNCFINQSYKYKKCYLVDNEQNTYIFNEKKNIVEPFNKNNIIEKIFIIFNSHHIYLPKFLENMVFYREIYPKYIITKRGFNLNDLTNQKKWYVKISDFNIFSTLFERIDNTLTYSFDRIKQKLENINRGKNILNSDPFNYYEKSLENYKDNFDTSIVENNFTALNPIQIKDILSNRQNVENDIFVNSKIVTFTQKYPSRKNIYRNNYVHMRVKSYNNYFSGVVINLIEEGEYTDYIYEGIRVVNVVKSDFHRLVFLNVEQISIHNLNRDIWNLIKTIPNINKLKINIFVHGDEIINNKSKILQNIEIWKYIYKLSSSLNINSYIDSRYLYKYLRRNYAINFPNNKIIYNAIDSNIFPYIKKGGEQRKKILIIRPFISVHNANALIIKVIMLLSNKKYFNDLTISIYGDGQLFNPLTSKIKQFRNIKIVKKLLNHNEISKIHKTNGIFLYPVNTESRGIAICEAMMSGLVPITNKKSSIPEYVDSDSGFLCNLDKPDEMVNAIERLYNDSNLFLKMSKNASRKNLHKFNIKSQYLTIVDDKFQRKRESEYLEQIIQLEKELIYFENIIDNNIAEIINLVKLNNDITNFIKELIKLNEILDYQEEEEKKEVLEENIEENSDGDENKEENSDGDENKEENSDGEEEKLETEENTGENLEEEEEKLETEENNGENLEEEEEKLETEENEEEKTETEENLEETNENNDKKEDLTTYFTEEEIKEIEESEKPENINEEADEIETENKYEEEINGYNLFETKILNYKEKISFYKDLCKEYQEFKKGVDKNIDIKDTSYLLNKINNILNIIESLNNFRNVINNF